jgi:hypothetical protein
MRGGRYQSGPHFSRPRAGLSYRGSPKRIRRIKWQDHTPPSFAALMLAGLALVLALIAWLITHPEAGHHHSGQVNVDSR